MYYIQSVIFRKTVYSKKQAIDFLKSNGFKFNKLDETDNFYRFRQINPQLLEDTGFNKVRTKVISKGIEFIIYYK